MTANDSSNRTAGPDLQPTELLSILTNEIRIEILVSLSSKRKSVGDIASELQLDPSAVSHALQTLRRAGLVDRDVIKKQHIYRTNDAVRLSRADRAIVLHIMTARCEVKLQTPRGP